MAIAANDRTIGPYVCTGGETLLPFDFPLLAPAVDLAVFRLRGGVESLLTPGVDYTLATGGGGGTVTLTPAAIAGDRYTLDGARLKARAVDLVQDRSFAASVLNSEYDNLEVQIQEAAREAGRAIRRKRTSTSTGSLELPDGPGALELDSAGAVQVNQTTAASRAAAEAAAVAAAASASWAAGSATYAAGSAAQAAFSATQAAASAEDASAAALLTILNARFDTYAQAVTGLAGVPADGVVLVFADETRGGATTIYRKTGGVYVYKLTLNTLSTANRRQVRAELGLVPIEGLRRCQSRFRAAHQGTGAQIRAVAHGDSVSGDPWQLLGPALHLAIGGPAPTYPVNDDAGDVAAVVVANLGFLCAASGAVTNLTTATDVWPNGVVMRAAVGTTSFKVGPFNPSWATFKLYWKKGPGQGAFDLVIGGVTVASYDAAAGAVALGVHTATQTFATTAVEVVVTSGTVDFVLATGCDTRYNGLWLLGLGLSGQTLLAQMQYPDARTLYGLFLNDFYPDVFTFAMKEVDNTDFPGSLINLFNTLDTYCPLADKLIFSPNPYTDETTPANEATLQVQNAQLLLACLARDDSYGYVHTWAAYGNNSRIDSYGLMGEPDDVHAKVMGSMHADHMLLDALGIGRHPWHHAPYPVNAPLRPSHLASGSTWGLRGIFLGAVEKIIKLVADATDMYDWSWVVGRRFRILDQSGNILFRVSNLAAGGYMSQVRNNLTTHADNGGSLGEAATRWGQVYSTVGTISTSDAREKQDVGAIPDEILRAWGRVQWSRFRWRQAVADKGDAARLHFGVIAQEVQAAFAAEGLDAMRLGVLCYDRWEDRWEDEVDYTTEPPRPVLDPATGRPVQKLVLAAGDRWGVRYDQAEALEAAYQRRRIADLEARLAAMGG